MSYKTHLKFWTSRFLHSFTNFFIYRGFFCDDENLRHPYVEELISTHACAAIWIAAVLFLVFFFQKWYFVFQNFSDLLWEKIVLLIEKNFRNSKLKAENLIFFEIITTIYSNSERSAQYLKENTFLTCSWRFLRFNTSKQL